MFNDHSKNLNELITSALSLRNLDVKKLSELTDIPIHYLTALIEGDFSKLPPAPYIRGYLLKIAEILKIDSDVILMAYKQEVLVQPLKISGPGDKLPSNRYALRGLDKKFFIIIGAILFLSIIYFGGWFDNFWGTPHLEIISPAVDNLVVDVSSIKLLGRAEPRDKLIINNEEVLISENGDFEKELSLQPGLNTIEFRVKRFLGKEARIVRQVIYQP